MSSLSQPLSSGMKFPCDWESHHFAGVSKGLENLALRQRRMNLFLENAGLFFDIAQFCHISPCFYWCIFKLFSPCCLTYCPELLGIQCYANSLLLLLLGKLQDTALNYSSPFLSSAYKSPWNYPPFPQNTNLPYRVFAYNQSFPADGPLWPLWAFQGCPSKWQPWEEGYA